MIGTGLAIYTTLPLPGDFLHISDVALTKPLLKAGSTFPLFSKLLNIPLGEACGGIAPDRKCVSN